MANEVAAELEIDGTVVTHFTDIFLTQRFNDHHEFSIRINHDVFEAAGSFSLDNSKMLIGKPAVIRFVESPVSKQVAYEFTGIICEVGMIRSHGSVGDLLIRGYSPTILLEDGSHLASFSDKSLNEIVTQTIQDAHSKFSFLDSVDAAHTSPIQYVCQYKESSFHFLNRLAADYGELFYYDGKTLIFGRQPNMEFVPVTYGRDMSHMQLNMHVQPIRVAEYAYNSVEDRMMASAGTEINGLDNFAQHVVQQSNSLYSKIDPLPLGQVVGTDSEVVEFVNKTKEAKAAGLVMLRGNSTNPFLYLGSVATVSVIRRNENIFTEEDYGVFLVTNITHHINVNGKYNNSFEALSSWVRGVPVYNIAKPKAEPQFGTVVANRDPARLHRVRVKLEWQVAPEKTPWIWVMTPDAGPGKDGAGGAGFVFNPQIGDRVLVGFEHNNPDLPFVMGSIFHGRSGTPPPATPEAEEPRCITARDSTSKVCIEGNCINITDGGGHFIRLYGDGRIFMEASTLIQLKVGDSYIMIEPSKISIKTTDLQVLGETVNIGGTTSATFQKDASAFFKAEGTQVTIKAATTVVEGTTTAEMKGPTVKSTAGTALELTSGANALLRGTGPTKVNGHPLDLNV